jgi:hypothetical protein
MPTSADVFPVVEGRCTGRAPVQGQAGPSWQDGADVWILTATVVRFFGRVQIFFSNQAALVTSLFVAFAPGHAKTDETPLCRRRVRISNSGGDCSVWTFNFVQDIDAEISRLEKARALLTEHKATKKSRTMSAEGRARIAAAQKKRWAKAKR